MQKCRPKQHKKLQQQHKKGAALTGRPFLHQTVTLSVYNRPVSLFDTLSNYAKMAEIYSFGYLTTFERGSDMFKNGLYSKAFIAIIALVLLFTPAMWLGFIMIGALLFWFAIDKQKTDNHDTSLVILGYIGGISYTFAGAVLLLAPHGIF